MANDWARGRDGGEVASRAGQALPADAVNLESGVEGLGSSVLRLGSVPNRVLDGSTGRQGGSGIDLSSSLHGQHRPQEHEDAQDEEHHRDRELDHCLPALLALPPLRQPHRLNTES